jgi:hypothetical protein
MNYCDVLLSHYPKLRLNTSLKHHTFKTVANLKNQTSPMGQPLSLSIDESREAFVQHVYISHAERDAQRR